MKTLGIVGGGQLGRMLCEAAKNLGLRTIVLDPTPDSPAGQVADEQIVGDFKNPQAIKKLAKHVDYLTFEIESAKAKTLQEIQRGGVPVHPSPRLLHTIQDKFLQKQLLAEANIPVAPFAPIKNNKDIEKCAAAWGYPLLLKARKHAYDGRGNYVVRSKKAIAPALKKLESNDLYVEKFVPFKKELAIQVARTAANKVLLFPLVETIQQNNICHIVKAPASVPPAVKRQAEMLGRQVGKLLQGAGVFGIEMFLTPKNKVLINELAPRVHNSGHYTIEACSVSQFEQHVRLVCDLPPKKITLLTPAVMINILGKHQGSARPQNTTLSKLPHAALHVYGKKESKPERKMGHLTAVGKTVPQALRRALQAKKLIRI